MSIQNLYLIGVTGGSREQSVAYKSNRKLRNRNGNEHWFIGFVNQRVTRSRMAVWLTEEG